MSLIFDNLFDLGLGVDLFTSGPTNLFGEQEVKELLFRDLFELLSGVDLFDIGPENLFQTAIDLPGGVINVDVDIVTPVAFTSILPIEPGTIEVSFAVLPASALTNTPTLTPGIVTDITVTIHDPTTSIEIAPLIPGTISLLLTTTSPTVQTQGVVDLDTIELFTEVIDASVTIFIPSIPTVVIPNIVLTMFTPTVSLDIITAPAQRTSYPQVETRKVISFAENPRTFIV